jgi:hypothetical protein
VSLQKAGLHIIGGYSGSLGRPRIVKLVDCSPEYLLQVRALVGPKCLIVVRWTLEDQPLDDPVRRAQEWYSAHRPLMVDPDALYEGYNEIPRGLCAPFAMFEKVRLQMMHAGERNSGVFSFAVGTPEIADWFVLQPVLDVMGAFDAVALHE